MDRIDFESKLAYSVIESLDMESLMMIAHEYLNSQYSKLGEDQFRNEIENFGTEELLEEYLNEVKHG
jgi:hypothetical protein